MMKETGREEGSFTLKSLMNKSPSNVSVVKNALTKIQSGRSFMKNHTFEEEKNKESKRSDRSEQSHDVNELSEMVGSADSHEFHDSSYSEEASESKEIEVDQVHQQAKIKRREKQKLLGDIANINQLFTNEDIPEIERSSTFGCLFTLTYIWLIFFFMISFLSEVRIEEPHDILVAFLDSVETRPFDAQGHRYKDITTVTHVADFIKYQLLNEIYDERIKTHANPTGHYIKEFNYFMGMRMTSERADKPETSPAQYKRTLGGVNLVEESQKSFTKSAPLSITEFMYENSTQRFLKTIEKEYFYSDIITISDAKNIYERMVSDGVFDKQYE